MRSSVLFVSLLVACAGPATGLRADLPPAPAPADLDHAQLSFDGSGGTKLYAQRWRPKAGDVRGVLVIHHGLADHSARYEALAERLVRGGYAVWALDMRGHARSSGVRVRIDRIDELLDDLDAFVALVRAREPGKPLFVLGHSLGGLTAALYAIERHPQIAGVVLSAPGIAFAAPPIQAGAIGVIAAVAPNARILMTPHADFSASRDVVADMNADPLIYQPSGPARTARAAVDGVARVWAHPEQLVAPLLAVHGTGDKIVSPIGSRDLVARAGGTDHTLRLYDGLNHDLLHEPNGGAERVAADIHAWLDAHTGGATAAPAPTASAATAGAASAALVSSPATAVHDARPSAMSVELDARGERSDAATGATAGLRFRLGVGRAAGLGYTGGLDLRAGYLDKGVYEADLHALGLALRSRGGALLAITGGVGIGGLRSASATHVPVEAALELPLGPTRVLARASLGWRLSGPDYAKDALGLADEATAFVGLRLGRDRHYWSTVVAGGGPYFGATYRNLGGGELIGLVLGTQFWGGN